MPFLLAACAHQPQLLGPPDRVWASPRGLESTASCVVGILDARGANLSPRITHARQVIEPGKVYEIRPRQESTVTTETYVVRLEKAGDEITRMSLYADSPWARDLIKALSRCGTRS